MQTSIVQHHTKELRIMDVS